MACLMCNIDCMRGHLEGHVGREKDNTYKFNSISQPVTHT